MSGAELRRVLADLASATKRLRFSAPVAFTYRPFDYAWPMVDAYVERYGQGRKEALFLGMNPGPFGMAQTGVPFGDVVTVRDYLKLDAAIVSPRPGDLHPKRPVQGLACPRVEVSGKRLWGAIARAHPKPATFFARAFVLNYCPLLFLAESGANLTPDKLAKAERARLEALCDEALAAAVKAMGATRLVGVGLYAKRALERVAPAGAVVTSIPHPSPASPQANRGWDGLAKSALGAAGLDGLL